MGKAFGGTGTARGAPAVRRRPRRWETVAAAAVLLLAACGDDGDEMVAPDEDRQDGRVQGEAPDGPTNAAAEVRDISIEAGEWTFHGMTAGPDDGDLVLFLHGFPTTADGWRPQMAALGGEGWRAVAFDQRGYSPGARPDAVEDYGMAALVGDVHAVADALDADRFHLVGHDWGAAVAWVVAAGSPERVQSLVAVSVPHPDAFGEAIRDDPDQRERSAYVEVFRRPGSEQQFLVDDAAGLRGIYGDRVPAETVEAYVETLGTPEALGAALNWYRATDFDGEARLGPVAVPTTLIWSDGDVAIGRAGVDATEDLVDADYHLEVLEGVSHWIPEEAPDAVTDAVRDRIGGADG